MNTSATAQSNARVTALDARIKTAKEALKFPRAPTDTLPIIAQLCQAAGLPRDADALAANGINVASFLNKVGSFPYKPEMLHPSAHADASLDVSKTTHYHVVSVSATLLSTFRALCTDLTLVTLFARIEALIQEASAGGVVLDQLPMFDEFAQLARKMAQATVPANVATMRRLLDLWSQFDQRVAAISQQNTDRPLAAALGRALHALDALERFLGHLFKRLYATLSDTKPIAFGVVANLGVPFGVDTSPLVKQFTARLVAFVDRDQPEDEEPHGLLLSPTPAALTSETMHCPRCHFRHVHDPLDPATPMECIYCMLGEQAAPLVTEYTAPAHPDSMEY